MSQITGAGIIVKPPILFSPLRFASFNLLTPSSSHNKAISISRPQKVVASMASEQSSVEAATSVPNSSIKLLFVEMGVGYDQHGCLSLPLAFYLFLIFFGFIIILTAKENRQDITSAAMRACRDAISSNSIPAFRRGTFTYLASYSSLNFTSFLLIHSSFCSVLIMKLYWQFNFWNI